MADTSWVVPIVSVTSTCFAMLKASVLQAAACACTHDSAGPSAGPAATHAAAPPRCVPLAPHLARHCPRSPAAGMA